MKPPRRIVQALFPVACLLAGLGFVEGREVDWDKQALDRYESPPLGLPPVPTPKDNPPTTEKIALGRKLFFDRRLSFNNTMSCGMCHVPEQGFTNNELATPVGVEGRSIRRNSPTILNAAYAKHIFHDGRDTSLETQTINPLLARDEMANPSMGWLIAKINGLSDYDGMFARAFGGGPTTDRIGKAIASWERTVVAANSPFDRWRYAGEKNALDTDAKKGFELFTGKALCIACHHIGAKYALFTDDAFHDTGIGYVSAEAERDDAPVPVETAPGEVIPMSRELIRSISEPRPSDLGRFEVTLNPKDKWRFKTPSLRNASVTAPYMHDGSLRTLEEVVGFYDRGGVPHEGLDPLIQPLDLTPEEIAALVAFLQSLTSPGITELAADARSVAVGD
jgi:cytochrome c peroxidase